MFLIRSRCADVVHGGCIGRSPRLGIRTNACPVLASLVGTFGLDKRKKWPPALLHAHGYDMYDVSECMYSVIPDAMYLITACGCVAA
eukprot:9164135-Ditylum_brightwellii.AAC.2